MEIMRVDFDIFGDYAGQKRQYLRKIPFWSQNLRKNPGNSKEILILKKKEARQMERAGKKTRDIQFYSEKNGRMVCLHSPAARDYAKYLEEQSWVESYDAGAPLSEELYCHVSPVGIRGLYFKTSWASDFLLHFADGRRGIRELVRADMLQKASTAERLEFSRRYWASTDIDEWKVVLVPG